MMNQIVLIDRKGKEVARLPNPPRPDNCGPWIYHAGQWWGFGVGKLNGEQHYYAATPETPPLGKGERKP